MIKRTPIMQQTIKDGGFFGKDGTWNSIVTFPGDSNVYRGRVETLIIRDYKEVFLKINSEGKYFLPGGSFGKDVSHLEQARNECLEEARIHVRNLQDSGFSYKQYRGVPEKNKHDDVQWNSNYTEIYTAEYDGIYKGDIPKVDRDPFILSGRFYPVNYCFKIFKKPHQDALKYYLKNTIGDKDIVTTEFAHTHNITNFIYKNIHSPEELYKWMHENVVEINTWYLRSPNEVYLEQSGSSHDQAVLEDYVFTKLRIPHGRLLLTEHNNIHSFLYFLGKKNHRYYWFENAWENENGIHGPYRTLDDLKESVLEKWGKQAKIYPVKNTEHNMSLRNYKMMCMKESDILEIRRLYLVSETNLQDSILYPKRPNNFFTRRGYEDGNVKRVSLSSSIDGALMNIPNKVSGKTLYVHTPITEVSDYHIPTKEEVPDADITGEVWLYKPVTLRCIGKIQLIQQSDKEGNVFTYGKHIGELYDWDWIWMDRKGIAL